MTGQIEYLGLLSIYRQSYSTWHLLQIEGYLTNVHDLGGGRTDAISVLAVFEWFVKHFHVLPRKQHENVIKNEKESYRRQNATLAGLVLCPRFYLDLVYNNLCRHILITAAHLFGITLRPLADTIRANGFESLPQIDEIQLMWIPTFRTLFLNDPGGFHVIANISG